MLFYLRILFIFHFFDHGFYFDLFPEKAAEKATSPGACSLAQAQIWYQPTGQEPITEDRTDFVFPPFEGSHFPAKHHHGDRKFCLDLPLREIVWQAPQLLPRLQRALDERNSAFQPTQIAQSLCGAGGLGLAGTCEAWKRSEKEAARMDEECKCEGTSWQRPGERQRAEPGRFGLPLRTGHGTALACTGNLVCIPNSLQQSDTSCSSCTIDSNCRCPIRRRAHFSSQGGISGPFQGSNTHPECRCQGRNDNVKVTDIRVAQDLSCSGQCDKGTQELEGGQDQAPGTLASSPTRFCQELGATIETL